MQLLEDARLLSICFFFLRVHCVLNNFMLDFPQWYALLSHLLWNKSLNLLVIYLLMSFFKFAYVLICTRKKLKNTLFLSWIIHNNLNLPRVSLRVIHLVQYNFDKNERACYKMKVDNRNSGSTSLLQNEFFFINIDVWFSLSLQ
jgi:hypothetical protein